MKFFVIIVLCFAFFSCGDPIGNTIPQKYLTSIVYNGNFFVTSSDGLIFRSENGINWELIYNNQREILLNSSIINENTLLISGESGLLLLSSNNGNTWQKLTTGQNSFFKTISILNDSTWYAAGRNGVIIETNNFGNTWEAIVSPTNETINNLLVIDDQKIILCTRNSNTGANIFTSTDGGENWSQLNFPESPSLNGIFQRDGEFIIYGVNLILKMDSNFENLEQIELFKQSNEIISFESGITENGLITLAGHSGFNNGKIYTGNNINSLSPLEIDLNMHFLDIIEINNIQYAVGGYDYSIAVKENNIWSKIILKNE